MKQHICINYMIAVDIIMYYIIQNYNIFYMLQRMKTIFPFQSFRTFVLDYFVVNQLVCALFILKALVIKSIRVKNATMFISS